MLISPSFNDVYNENSVPSNQIIFDQQPLTHQKIKCPNQLPSTFTNNDNYCYTRKDFKYLPKDGKYVAYYNCKKKRSCGCTKTLKMSWSPSNPDTVLKSYTDNNGQHFCTIVDQEMSEAPIDVSDLMREQVIKFAVENGNSTALTVAEKIFEDVRAQFSGKNIVFP